MKFIIACILFAVYVAAEDHELSCADTSVFCNHLKVVNTCKYFQSTRDMCPRSCGKCAVNCGRVEAYSRQQCGVPATTKEQCYQQGCCWGPTNDNSATPWCYATGSDRGDADDFFSNI